MRPQLKRWTTGAGTVLAILLAVTVSGSAAAVDEVANWNAIATSVALPGGKNAIEQSRIYAMVQLAVHDALNTIERRYARYAYHAHPHGRASAAAAVATSAHDVLVHEVPAQIAVVDAALAASLSSVPAGPAADRGVEIGHAAAAAILSRRAKDGSNVVTPYVPGTAPGQWQPTPNPSPPNPPGPGLLPAVLPGWGNVQPFALASSAEFRPAPPPSLTGGRYARDYEEVRAIGEQFSTVRTAEESTSAQFWYEGSQIGWNRIARNIAAARDLDMWQEARLLALVNVAMADGFISGMNAKYLYNFWRPVTAIRAGDTDGNDATVADAGWNSYLNSPAIPDYPSTHSVLGAAAAVVMARFFHSDHIAFTTTSGVPFPGITRSFTSVWEAALDNANSRVLAGIHFRSACNAGLKLGWSIGLTTPERILRPVGRRHH